MSGSSSETVLVLVCGLPAAGKTTLVKHLEASSSTPSRLYERISLDDLYGQQVVDSAGSEPVEFDPGTWKASQRDMVERVSKRLEEHNASARSNGTTLQLVLLVDDIFQYRSLRKRFFHLATQCKTSLSIRLDSCTVTDMSLVTCSELRLWSSVREGTSSNLPSTECWSERGWKWWCASS